MADGLDSAETGWPAVSVVMAIRDDERHLRHSVNHILAQDYPGSLEVILALSPARDRTSEIARAAAQRDPRMRVVENPAGTTPSGLNVAIAHASHDIIVRVDGRGLLDPGYIRRAVEILEETGADNVGGACIPHDETAFGEALSRAMIHPLGNGRKNGRFHPNGRPGPVDTVYLGVLRRQILDQLGGYNETLPRAQDWELNYRIRRAGGTVWYDPDLHVVYRSQPTMASLIQQFYLNGRSRRLVARLHRGTLNLRYLAPPLAVIACVLGILVSLASAVAFPELAATAAAVPTTYVLGVVLASVTAGRGLSPRARLWLPVVMIAMHMSWGVGFLAKPTPARTPLLLAQSSQR
ncbi:glycosyltransferase family 2 protein [Actinopolymorpha alba]|uniref:glycosyltransferase family 2 protein n=1 Tax=Actinopolymorpha alba TaxID=533267 RepID=UPI0003672B81|nr:glycosyltransferase family 2 protein [Actinopolymorpha alba]